MIRKIGENVFLIFALLWSALWILPWAIWLDSLPWIRMGVSISIFVAPGVALSLILASKRLTLIGHFASGFALSVFFVGSLGLLGRKLHMPFEFIKPAFAVTGLIVLFVLSRCARSEHRIYRPQNFSIIPLVLLLSIAIFSMIISLQNRFHNDDFSYLAYLTNWQHAQHLNFQEVFFGSGHPDSIRFWLAMFPMNLAFVAEISHLHGLLLLGLYLGPFLITSAILAAYALYEDLFRSEYLAISALLLQFTFLFVLRSNMQSGNYFFIRITHDKLFAAFVLAPVFFLAIRYFLESFTLRSGMFFLFIGWGLALTHPVILAYSIFIGGFYASIVTIIKKEFKKTGIVMAILVITILPSASFRFVELPWVSRYVFGLESNLLQPGAFDLESASETVNIKSRITYIKGTPFYGFPLEQIKIQMNHKNTENLWQALFSWSYLWVLILGFLWSLFNLKKNIVAPFVIATSSLILICAIPYTGWLMGYLVSARMLWRSPWLLPIGLIGVVLVTEFLKIMPYKILVNTRSGISREWTVLSLISVICFIVIISGSYSIPTYQGLRNGQIFKNLVGYKNKMERFSILGDYLENNIEKPSVFVAQPGLSDYLPGLSSKSKVVFFRSAIFTPRQVNTKRINRIFSQDGSISIADRVDILKEYHIQYILVEDRVLKDYYASYPKFFSVQEVDGFWLIDLQDLVIN